MHPFPTVNAIVDQIIITWSQEDLDFVLAMPHDALGLIDRRIRNDFGLWDSHPLTEKWRTDESSRDIRNGIDYSPDHPDNLADEIRKVLVRRLGGKV